MNACRYRGRAAAALLVTASAVVLARAANAQTLEDLGNMSIEQLSQIEVSSPSKRLQPVSEAPTSIYVLTGKEIAESAATSLPEALRLAPNLQVQQVDARQYAISARGFDGYENANKLLVLIDGRSVYTTLHSGVFWELHSPLLEDIDQIEVISGPGGTLFGPNAVNGVISVTSKDAHDTLGGLARATAGGREQTAALRYGTSVGSSGAVRVYADAWNRAQMPDGAGPDGNDHFKGFQAGFRADLGPAASDLTLQGDFFRTDTTGNPAFANDGDRGGNLLARWHHEVGARTSIQLQAYYDDYERRFTLVRDKVETLDAEAQLNGERGAHDFVLGAGVRTTRDAFINHLNGFVLDPERRRLWIGNIFGQDEIRLSPGLSVIAGLKLEHSSFSGAELLPNLRLAWKPGDHALVWAAVSRAVRTPSRIDRQLVFPGLLSPASDFQSEKLVAFEGGYRGSIGPGTTLSVSLFFNRYDDIRATSFTPGPLVPFKLTNGWDGHSYGLEAWAAHQLASWWRLNLGISTLQEHFRLKPGFNDATGGIALGANPHYQATARSEMRIASSITLRADFRAVDGTKRQHIPAYAEADARLAWQATKQLELYIAGNNLLHKTHAETMDPNRAQLIERSVYGGTRIHF